MPQPQGQPPAPPPHSPAGQALGLLRAAHQQLASGSAGEAAAAADRALALAPAEIGIACMAADLYMRLGRAADAASAGLLALELAPNDPDLRVDVAGMLIMAQRPKDAIPHLERVLAQNPAHLTAGDNLLAALIADKQDGRAEAEARRLLLFAQRHPALLGNIASAFQRAGFPNEACDAVLAHLNSGQAGPPLTDSMCIYASYLNYAANAPAADVAQMHRLVGQSIEAPAASQPRYAHNNARDPDRILRVGFVSPDLRHHSVAYFLEPILEHLDRARVFVAAYSTSTTTDATTQRLKGRCDAWTDAAGFSPRQLADRIAADAIDILLDLGGLFQGHSQPTFALRPAPVQITYLGYPNTTGGQYMQWRIVDSLTDPAGSEHLSTERLLRVDPCFLCYRPPSDLPPVLARPDSTDAPVVFGCMGSLAKYTEQQIYLWCRVIQAVPGSRLVLKNPAFADPVLRDRTRRRVALYLSDHARLELLPPSPETADHLGVYNSIDIALDTFPYHGTTTTVEATVMGVPTVTLVGDRHASRVGLSLLSAVGIPDLAAPTEGEFLHRAIQLAGDAARRATLRKTLRPTLLASPLCDGPGFASRFEQALRSAWHAWCRQPIP